MGKKTIEIKLPKDNQTVKRVSRAVLGSTPATKPILPKKEKDAKHKKKDKEGWVEN